MNFDYRGDRVLGGVLSHWTDIRGSRLMPARHDLKPSKIQRLLPNLQLIDVVDNGQRFLHRLVGTKLVDMFGQEFTNKYLDELLTGERYELMSRLYADVCQARRPIFIRNLYLSSRGVDIVTNRIYLPLSDDEVEVTMILCAITFDSPHGLSGEWRTAILENRQSYREEIDCAR